MELADKLFEPETKRCSKCRVVKPTSEFYPRKRATSGLTSACRACTNAVAIAWGKKNHEEIARRKRNRERKRKWGLSAEDYEDMLARQDGKCAICRRSPEELWVESGRKGPTQLAVDHSHATGLVRGLLCFRCNRAVGLLRDDPNILERGRCYLRGQ